MLLLAKIALFVWEIDDDLDHLNHVKAVNVKLTCYYFIPRTAIQDYLKFVSRTISLKLIEHSRTVVSARRSAAHISTPMRTLELCSENPELMSKFRMLALHGFILNWSKQYNFEQSGLFPNLAALINRIFGPYWIGIIRKQLYLHVNCYVINI